MKITILYINAFAVDLSRERSFFIFTMNIPILKILPSIIKVASDEKSLSSASQTLFIRSVNLVGLLKQNIDCWDARQSLIQYVWDGAQEYAANKCPGDAEAPGNYTYRVNLAPTICLFIWFFLSC